MKEIRNSRMPMKRISRSHLDRAIVAMSLLLNVGLLLVLATSKSEQSGVTTTPQLRESGSFSVSEPDGYEGYRQYYAKLLAHGWSHEETKPMLLARLEMETRRASASQKAEYWESFDASRVELPLRLATGLEQAREVLVQVYGPDAKHDPAFSSAFRPLGPAFTFLTSEQHIEIQNLRIEQQLSIARASTTAMQLGAPQLRVSSDLYPVNTPFAPTLFESRLAAALDEKALFEYRLRDSTLAEQLRRSGLEFSEEKFRETFRILDRLEESRGNQDVYAGARHALRELLGSRQFARLWAGRDPTFVAIKQAGDQHSLTDDTILTVYELFNDSEDRVIAVTRDAENDPERGARGVREERAELRRRLIGLVGEGVAEDILRAQIRHISTLINSQELVPGGPVGREP